MMIIMKTMKIEVFQATRINQYSDIIAPHTAITSFSILAPSGLW
jgi:hypothetical protein